ncbi:Ribosomal RNA small subunit methyltransferase E [Stieleria neptunia]|uniref:Ribosomal RNA small subunit methyltransferase E n=1 Tax=Stieleria neptunia TaxID=2527979 RepID=A0A518HQD1_9BACT|nr:RsmE family RNA methyltransferase [Stieleria neptunia]QDV43064.1 Ribosomal RNA small subunit methyltransferase E [Stieleria neptunia]
MTRRYYAPDLAPGGGLVPLSDAEASHAARVMRAKVGDVITLFDGCGHESESSIVSIDKRNCVVQAAAAVAIDREPKCRTHLGIALPKPERCKEMIERLTELGVHRVTPLVCQRTQRPPTDSLLTKLRRIVIESSKQCERNVLMTIDAPTSMEAFLAEPRDGVRWIAHPDGKPIQSLAAQSLAAQSLAAEIDAATSATVLIGPEGGFSDEEVQTAVDSGYRQIGLAARIYRVETAACVVAAHLAG